MKREHIVINQNLIIKYLNIYYSNKWIYNRNIFSEATHCCTGGIFAFWRRWLWSIIFGSNINIDLPVFLWSHWIFVFFCTSEKRGEKFFFQFSCFFVSSINVGFTRVYGWKEKVSFLVLIEFRGKECFDQK